MDTLRTRRPLEMAVLLALLIAIRMSWVPTTGANGIICHACEVENSFNCSNPRLCKASERFCVVAAIKFYERFYISSKQCSRYCPVPLDETHFSGAGPLQPKHFVAQKPLPFLYARCCRWDLCNSYAPSIPQFKEQPGKASERRYNTLSCSCLASWSLLLLGSQTSACCKLQRDLEHACGPRIPWTPMDPSDQNRFHS
ncbi:Lymphocyte antigen 6K [Lemmus lemmus]